MVTAANLTKKRLTATMAAEKRDREYRTYIEYRRKYLPGQIENTLAKLEALLNEATRREVPFADNWIARWENLRSKYLTDPALVSREWEREVKKFKAEDESNDD